MWLLKIKKSLICYIWTLTTKENLIKFMEDIEPMGKISDHDFENNLRLFIDDILISKYEKDYLSLSQFKKYKENWERFKHKEENKRLAGIREERLIFYSSLKNLKNIISSHWSVFKPWLKNGDTFEFWLKEIINYKRDPDAHRREIGSNEEQRVQLNYKCIMKLIDDYRREKTSIEDFHCPVIIEIKDSLGNVNKNSFAKDTGGDWSEGRDIPNVRVGEEITFTIYAHNYENEPIEYQYLVHTRAFERTKDWCNDNKWTWKVNKDEIGMRRLVMLRIRTKRDYHALGDVDDYTYAIYNVLPRK